MRIIDQQKDRLFFDLRLSQITQLTSKLKHWKYLKTLVCDDLGNDLVGRGMQSSKEDSKTKARCRVPQYSVSRATQ